MASRRRIFKRPSGKRRYKKLFILATEGTKTEPQYFSIFNGQDSIIRVNCLKRKHGASPPEILRQMRKHLREEDLKQSDEAWLVVDKDQWTDAQLSQLHEWSQESDNCGFALSNPKFEFWLLLHFEAGNNVTNSQICSEKLEKHLPDYDKNLDVRKFTKAMIRDAIKRAKERDKPPCKSWPCKTGSTVYKLVENILNSQKNH